MTVYKKRRQKTQLRQNAVYERQKKRQNNTPPRQSGNDTPSAYLSDALEAAQPPALPEVAI